MTSEQGTRTPAQQALFELVTGGTEFTIADKAIHNWVAEVAADVRALAATVAELKRKAIHTESWMASYDDAKSEIIGRLAALESPGSAEPEPSSCKDKFGEMCDGSCCKPGSAEAAPYSPSSYLNDLGINVRPDAPEPVCEIGDRCDGSCQKCEDRMFERIYGGESEQAVNQEPPALDPVRLEAAAMALHESNGFVTPWDDLTEFTRLRFRNDAERTIRAYGADAREGGK